MRVRACVLAVLAVAGCGGKSHGSHASLTVTPARGLADAPVAVRVRGLEPHAAVTLRASWTGFRGQRADSAIALRADGDGRIDLRGFDGDRFLWGMRGPFALPATADTVVRLALMEGGKVVAHGDVHRRVATPGMRARALTVGRDGLVGFFYAPTTARRRGAVLALGGSDGAAPAPSSFATRGFEARLADHHFGFFHERLDYPRAGHDIGSAIPYVPQPDPIHYGGDPRASALAKTKLWPRILDFLDDHAQ